MTVRFQFPFTTVLSALLLSAFALTNVSALSQEYCSGENTGTDDSQGENTYNSNGACSENCSGFAFGVVQYKSCWCTNYIPSQQQTTGDCNQGCPGYPDDLCGNADEGLFGYLALGPAPSGTAGASSSPAVSSLSSAATSSFSSPSSSAAEYSSSESSTPTPSQTPTSTSSTYHTPSPTSSSQTQTSSSAAPSTSSPASSSSTSSSRTMPVVVSTQVVISSGAPVTRTITSTPDATALVPSSASDMPDFHREGLSGGAVAGIVVGVLAGVAALALAAFLFWRRRASPQDEGGSRRPRRNASVLSRSGLLSRGRPSMGENILDDSTMYGHGAGDSSVRHSMLFTVPTIGEVVGPESPFEGDENNGARRHSKPLVYDQRLNPSALFPNHDNGSRISMQDNADYSRPLGVANPDLRSSFDSRRSYWE